jgi:hypothetical protein
VALLIGLSLERTKRPLLITWSVVVTLIAINGFISNRRSDYDWQVAANRAETVVKSIVAFQKRHPTKSIICVTTTPGTFGYWDIVIGGPMIPLVLGSPDMTVSIVEADDQAHPDAEVYHLPE